MIRKKKSKAPQPNFEALKIVIKFMGSTTAYKKVKKNLILIFP
jgi:hypothetical protein